MAEWTREQCETVADLIDEAMDNQGSTFMHGYLMGACVLAGVLGFPEELWASPQRERRREAADGA